MSSLTRFAPFIPSTPRGLDADATRAFESIRSAILNVYKHPLLDGVLVQNVFLPAATIVTIQHKLGRAWRGWFTTRWIGVNNTANTVREGGSPPAGYVSPDPKLFLDLKATNDVTIDVWIF